MNGIGAKFSIGNSKITMCFDNINKKNNKEQKYFYPKSILKEPIKENSSSLCKIVAILSTSKGKEYYENIDFINTKDGYSFNDLFNSDEIALKLDWGNLKRYY